MRRWTRPDVPILAIISHRKSDFYRPDARHQEHEMNVALSGEAIYRLDDGEPTHLTAGEILLMPAGTVHAIEVKDHFSMAAIHIHPKAFEGVAARRGPQATMLEKLKTWKQRLPWRKVVAPDVYTVLERLAEEAVVEQNRQAPAQLSLLGGLAVEAAVLFLRLMLLEQTAATSDRTTRLILTVQSWIDRHFAEECSLADLARMAHLAPTYFAARFREVVGVPPMTYVRDCRLKQARLLLERTGHPVKLVAWSVGYSDISHFNRVFKQATGATPGRYHLRGRRSANTD
ncbi:MAG: helix-turn-helix domain-containing protein [Planctomycetes bacterium]|nr:helix-turn-helix domain-containing protein [Planctomycetota bacterium]